MKFESDFDFKVRFVKFDQDYPSFFFFDVAKAILRSD